LAIDYAVKVFGAVGIGRIHQRVSERPSENFSSGNLERDIAGRVIIGTCHQPHTLNVTDFGRDSNFVPRLALHWG